MRKTTTTTYSKTVIIIALLLQNFVVFSSSNNEMEIIDTTVIRGPYLQSGTSNSIVIKWRTSNDTDSKVWYGPSPDNLNQTEAIPGSREDHEITISGLAAGTIYYYGVGDSAALMEGADSEHYFKTAPMLGDTGPVTAWVLGDCGTGNSDQEDVRDAYYNYVGNNHTDMILMLGDNAYKDGSDDDYQEAVFDMYPDKLKNTMLWSCPGNHEYTDESGLDAPYYDIFSFPTSGQSGGLASNSEQYYAFDYGNMHVISMDTEEEDLDPGSPMVDWLENDLAATTQEWIVVIFHHPPYSKGSHDSDDSKPLVDARENLVPICEAYGVDLVLAGHSHSYERSKLINGQYGSSSDYDPLIHDVDGGDGRLQGNGAYRQNDDEGGTVYIVTGSAGKITSVDDHPVMYYSASQLGSTILEVDGDQMDVKFLNDSGEVEDYLTIMQNDEAGQGGDISLAWISPTHGQVFPNLSMIPLMASATDLGNTITQVEFFVNGISIGTDLDAPYTKDWIATTYGTHTLRVKATNDIGEILSKNITITVEDGSIPTDLVVPIEDGDDDVEERKADGNIAFNSSDLEISYDVNLNIDQIVGLRFNELSIPAGATISKAYIQFTVDESTSDEANLVIKGEAHDNATPFLNIEYNLSSRVPTNDSVSWIPPAWLNVGSAGSDEQTPNISGIVQEIVNRPGWTKGNSLVFTIAGIGSRVAESYNSNSGDQPVLHISYTTNSCGGFEDEDNDGFCSDIDCDDTDENVHPGAIEITDGQDNNCDGQTDEGIFVNWMNPVNGQVFPDLSTISLMVSATDLHHAITQVEFFIDGVSIGADLNAPYTKDWTATAYGTYTLTATVTNNNGETVSKNISITIEDDSIVIPTDIAVSISDSDDDAEERNSNGSVNLVSSDLELSDDGSTNQTIGLRFNGLSMPQEAIILNAYIQFTVNESSSDETNLIIKGEAHDNATTFEDDNSNISSRVPTNGAVNWIPAAWLDIGEAGPDQRTPNIRMIVQEIVNRSGWAEGNSLVFTITGSGLRVADSYNEDPATAPTLHVSYAINPCAGLGDADNDGYCADVDCDDNNENVYPGAVEICDGLDNNCDVQIDEGLLTIYYVDIDGDGYGDPTNSIQSCTMSNGYVTNDSDCDDSNATVYLGATEICDGLDNNCDGQTDEGLLTTYYIDIDGDGFGDLTNSIQSCTMPIGYVTNSSDCDDNNGAVYLGATEICDGLDNNCDGQTDEGLLTTYYVDIDGDGFGDPTNSIQSCTVLIGYVTNDLDCDDNNNVVFLGATCDDGNSNTENDMIDSDCICSGTLIVTCYDEVIDFNDFESGWGIWNDGGSDANLSDNYEPYANSGDYCVRLRDNSSTSHITTNILDLSPYEELTIEFYYYSRNLSGNSEGFWLQISNDGGDSYNTVATWIIDIDFENDELYMDEVVISGVFSENSLLRFRCDASSNFDYIYLDDILISGCETITNISNLDAPTGSNYSEELIKDKTDVNAVATQNENALSLFPSYVINEVNIDYESLLGKTASLEIYNQQGEKVFLQQFNPSVGRNLFQLDLSHLPGGLYVVRILEEGHGQTAKMIIQY